MLAIDDASTSTWNVKEEKEQLERKVQGLNAHLQHLAQQGEFAKRREVVLARVQQNQELRNSIRGQRIIFANTQSFISEFLVRWQARAHDHSLYEPVIRLGTDPRERHETLLAMKPQRLEEALYFLSERSRQMSMDTEFTDLQRFQAANGDMCMVRFDVKPLHKARNVRQAFDGVLQFSYNLEISISELIGDITVRENDDTDWDSTVAQHRLVTSITDDVQVDTNNVTFAQFWGDGSGPRADRTIGDEVGLAVCNYVDDDALFPYRPSERVRQDITFFVMVAAYPRSATSSASTGSVSTASDCGSSVNDDHEQEQMVVATRWTCLRLRKPEFPLDADIASHIRDGMEQVGQAMFTAIRHSVNARSTARAP
ncbi:hypothetical protein BBJ28_00003605 [Nothophytophthora sp. Chile5]|nr:hypothetical protein BBJ28_00003605 [Nothophytophthora sp. Chile5]